MPVAACLQQGDMLFFQPLSELFSGMAEAVEGAAGGHHQPGTHSRQEFRQKRAVRAVVRCQQDIGLHVLAAGQQVAPSASPGKRARPCPLWTRRRIREALLPSQT